MIPFFFAEQQQNQKSADPQRLLEGGGLVLRILGNGGVSAGALAAPHLLAARCVPVLVRGLRELRPHLHQVLWVGLHQRLGGEQTQVCATHTSNHKTEENRLVPKVASVRMCIYSKRESVFVSTQACIRFELTQFERSC